MKILVTGASGGYGNYAINYLKEYADKNDEIIGLVRNEQKAQILKDNNIAYRIGDYDDINSLNAAFKDIDRLLFVSVPNFSLQQNVVKAIEQSNINYVAYTSIYAVNKNKLGLEENHLNTENLIKKTGIDHTFLRNNWYLEIIAPFLKAASDAGKFDYYSGDKKISWALKREYAEAGAKVILNKNENEILNLSGNPVTLRDLGQATAKAMNKNIEIDEVNKDEFGKYLNKIDISSLGTMLVNTYQDYAINGNNGEDKANSKTFENILGHPLTPLDKGISELIK